MWRTEGFTSKASQGSWDKGTNAQAHVVPAAQKRSTHRAWAASEQQQFTLGVKSTRFPQRMLSHAASCLRDMVLMGDNHQKNKTKQPTKVKYWHNGNNIINNVVPLCLRLWLETLCNLKILPQNTQTDRQINLIGSSFSPRFLRI